VDVFLISGELRIGHTIGETVPGRTLTSEYLNQPRLGELDQLMIDMKSDASYTTDQLFAAIVAVVTAHPATSGGTLPVIVSGTTPMPDTAIEHPSWVQFDGSYSNVWFVHSRAANPIISSPWSSYFTWTGTGAMPLAEERTLWSMSAKCFENGRQLRFYGAADNTAVWRQLWRAGIDWIGADDLAAFAAWRNALA
jgi:hypothetical protein